MSAKILVSWVVIFFIVGGTSALIVINLSDWLDRKSHWREPDDEEFTFSRVPFFWGVLGGLTIYGIAYLAWRWLT